MTSTASSRAASSRLSPEWSQVRRILAVRLDNIGDVIMLGPALRALKENLPGCQTTLMASPGGSSAAEMLPWVDEVLPWAAVWQEIDNRFGTNPEREQLLIEQLRRREIDAAFLFTSFSQSPYPPAYACYLAGIPIRVGQTREFGGGLLTHWYKPPEDGGHQAERNLILLESAGFTVSNRRLELEIPPSTSERAKQILRSVKIDPESDYIVYAPGASAAARRYDMHRAARTVVILAETTGMPVIAAGAEREARHLEPVLEACDGKRVISLVGMTSLGEMAAIIKGCKLAAANNSAALHIAEAFNRPMVIFYSGAEHPGQWTPRFAPAALLGRETPCAPCHLFTCPYQMECLDIEPEEAVEAAVRLIQPEGALPTHAERKSESNGWGHSQAVGFSNSEQATRG